MANIKLVAERAGVSVATASRALSGKGPVSEETRRRVLEAARALDFTPNLLARGLARRRTMTLAIVLPDISNPFFPAIARGVEDAASTGGYAVFLCNTDNLYENEESYLAALRRRMVDGIIFIPATERAEQYVDLLAGWTVVLVDRDVPGLPADAVLVDNRAGCREATRYLIGLGHRHIAHLAGPPGLATAEQRKQGYVEALAEAGILPHQPWVLHGPFDFGGGYRGMKRLLETRPRPTAVVCANDLIAMGAIKACQEAGLRVPEDISLTGFDDIFVSSMIHPPLTTVVQPGHLMGVKAAELLLARLEGRKPQEDGGPVRVVLTPHLVVRGSCGPPPRRG